MFKDDFIKYLFFLCLIILLLYVFQPSFWNSHPGLIRFFSQDSSAPASGGSTATSSEARLSQVVLGEDYTRISGVSISSAGDVGELRISVAKNSPREVDLGGWKIKTSLTTITIPTARIPAGGTLTISSLSAPVSGAAPRTYYLGQRFMNLSDTIYLYSKSGTLVDKYAY